MCFCSFQPQNHGLGLFLCWSVTFDQFLDMFTVILVSLIVSFIDTQSSLSLTELSALFYMSFFLLEELSFQLKWSSSELQSVFSLNYFMVCSFLEILIYCTEYPVLVVLSNVSPFKTQSDTKTSERFHDSHV